MTFKLTPRLASQIAQWSCIGVAALGLVANSGCKKKKPAEAEKKPAVEAPPPEPESTKAVNIDLSGPRPPAVSATFFAINGAMMPIACFDANKKTLAGGPDCGKQVPAGAEVYLASETGTQLDKVGAPKNSLCEPGGKNRSFGASVVDSGGSYDYAVWPRPAGALIKLVPSRSLKPRKAKLESAESEAIIAAIRKKIGKAKAGALSSNQKAALDIDGNGKDEIFISATLAHPTDPDQVLMSGLWYAPDGDLSKLELIDKSRGRLPGTVVLRGILDLNGDGRSEIWTTLTFDGGAGDRVYAWDGNKPRPLAKWSCGV